VAVEEALAVRNLVEQVEGQPLRVLLHLAVEPVIQQTWIQE
jgi:hypothetical protein